ncbi:MAG: glucose-1-phosphate adenylyltransferase [Actinomycetia bacterium]|nr:glucose-1-phosphate adenylyltransferase [Actinomycetes bacterium]
MESTTRPQVLSMVLAGGEGKRLAPLTLDRAKPAVPFAGHYRLIDFALSNLVNGGYRKIAVLTQYKSHSLDVHISTTWRLAAFLGNYVTSVPAQMRRGAQWFLGSADAIHQNMNLINDERPQYIFVFGADHIYRMDPRQMLDHHIASGAGATLAAIRVPVEQAYQFGVIEVGDFDRIERFHEKPAEVVGMAEDPKSVLASMGNYVFDTDVLVDLVRRNASDESTGYDIGGDLIPQLVDEGVAHVYDFTTNRVPGETHGGEPYWRDVGTLDAYYEAHMDLVAPEPRFNLYNADWPIHTSTRALPPAKLVVSPGQGAGEIADSMVSNGAVVERARVWRSVLAPRVHIEPGADVEGAILLDRVTVESGAIVRRAIVDKNVVIRSGVQIGVDPVLDRERFAVSDNGVVVIPKGAVLEP